MSTPTSGFIELTSGSFAAGPNTLTYLAATDNVFAATVEDNDMSGDVSGGDTWRGSNWTYAGFTIEIGGEEYAVFVNQFSPTSFAIPHQGEINASDMPASPATGTPNPNADVANCFAEGTGIATPNGRVAVEELEIGDEIFTSDGGVIRVKWIGHQRIHPRFGAPDRRRLVLMSEGALGRGLPMRDLRVTADHALFLNGVFVTAAALINGGSIRYESATDEPFTVYHIETDAHQVILAEGAPVETYIDYMARQAFDNYREYRAIYGEDQAVPEAAWPRVTRPEQLPPTLARRLFRKAAA